MKKVLIVTYYWPPAGGPGVQRWLKFVKYLPENGYQPILYVPKNPNYPILDTSLESEIPVDLKIIKRPIFEPYVVAGVFSKKKTQKIASGIISEEKNQDLLQKILLYIRGNFFIPDARKFWIKPSVKFLSQYLQKEEIDTVITSGPPHSMHLIGLELKKQLKLNWIADFRDPWTEIGYHKDLKLNVKSERKHKELEKSVLQQADHIITTSFTTKAAFRVHGNTPITVITNGHDFENIPKGELDKNFSISHIGSLLSGRNPINLWKALAEICIENPDFQKDFQLKLAGTVGETVLESIKEYGLEKNLQQLGYISHPEALKLQRSSQMLLLIEIDTPEAKGIIPGKIFEYMLSQRPILAVGPEAADFKKIIQETNTGHFFEYCEKDKIKSYLLDSYNAFQQKELQVFPIGLQKYSRQNLTESLAWVLEHTQEVNPH